MPAQIFGAQANVIQLYEAFFNAAPSNPIYNNALAVTAASSPQAYALTLGNQFATVSDAALALQVLNNLGITATTVTAAGSYSALLAGLTAAFAGYPTQRGIVVLNLTNILSTLETDAVFGSVAQVYNQTITNAFIYAANSTNVQTQTIGSISSTPPLSVNAGDSITGTSGNDSINANLFFNSPSGTFFQTLQTGDVVNGGAGTDTLNVGFNNSPGFIGAQNISATLTSIENIAVNATGSSFTTLDMTNSTGLTTLSLTNGTTGGDLTLTGVGTVLSSISLNNTTAGVTITSTTAAVAGTADTVALNLSQVTAATAVSLAGYETINVASSGPVTNSINIAGYSASANFVATGTTSLTVATGTSTNAVTINASGMTGTAALTVTANTAANNVTATGTGNNDTFTLGAFYTSADVIAGGAGTDTLSVTTAMAGGISANQGNLTTLEVLSISDATTAVTYTPASFGGATTLTLTTASAAAYTVNYGAGTGGLNVAASNGVSTLNSTGSATTDVLNVTTGTSTTAGVTQGAMATNGFETVNLTSNGALAAVNTMTSITMLASAASEVLNISGARDVTFTGNIQADVINASALTGNLTMASSTSAPFPVVASGVIITGGAGNDSLVGSAAADQITGGAGNDRLVVGPVDSANQADILTGGAGNDQFRFLATTQAALLAESAGTAQIVKVTDFTAGTDKIALVGGFTAAGTATLATAQTIATAADLTAVYAGITAIAASTATNASAVVVTVSAGLAAGTYVYINDATAAVSSATDMLINISGLTGTFTTADFAFS